MGEVKGIEVWRKSSEMQWSEVMWCEVKWSGRKFERG